MQRTALFTTLILAASLLGSFNSQLEASRLSLAPEPVTKDAVTAIYDPATGNLSVTSDIRVTSLQVTSSNSLFIPEGVKPGVMKSPFDVLTESKWFVLNLDGFTDLDVGPIYPVGMELESILDDLSVDGSFENGGALNRELNTSPHLYIVPEPASVILLSIAALSLLGIRRNMQ